MNVNAVGPINIISTLLPNLEQDNEKIMVMVSGKKSSIASNKQGNNYAYRTSKPALNCMIFAFAIDTRDKNNKVFLFHPSSVKTDMNSEAVIPVHLSVGNMVKLIKNADKFASGTFLHHEGYVLPW